MYKERENKNMISNTRKLPIIIRSKKISKLSCYTNMYINFYIWKNRHRCCINILEGTVGKLLNMKRGSYDGRQDLFIYSDSLRYLKFSSRKIYQLILISNKMEDWI